MNIPDYIASGMLESYALGTVSDQERREVECLSGIYPEIRQELDRLTLALENYALLHSVEPPADLQARIRARLTVNETPLTPLADTDTQVVPLHRERPIFQGAWIAAAAIGLVLMAFAYYLISQIRTEQGLNNEMASANARLRTELSQLRRQRQHDAELLAILRQPGMATVRLAAAKPNGARADVLVYWNRPKRLVTLEVESLPELAADQQYQLWALVDGKPVDAGVFSDRTQPLALQQTNRPITAADQFAITVEKAGGSPTPTLSALVAVGKVG